VGALARWRVGGNWTDGRTHFVPLAMPMAARRMQVRAGSDDGAKKVHDWILQVDGDVETCTRVVTSSARKRRRPWTMQYAATPQTESFRDGKRNTPLMISWFQTDVMAVMSVAVPIM
jgi:hypothetical protein